MLKFNIEPGLIDNANLNLATSSYETLLARTDIGFKDLPKQEHLIAESLHWAEHFNSYETLGLIGIGGSSVGAESLYSILCTTQKKLVIFDNIDALNLRRNLKDLNLKKTCWFVVSKSGSTLETLINTEFIAEFYKEKNINFYSQVVVCTENQINPLKNWAIKHNLPCLEIPKNVGGRFSVLSPAGLFPLAWAGVDIRALLAGAKEAVLDKQTLTKVCARVLSSFKNQHITVFFFYSSLIKPLGPWIQQLWAESLAKQKDRKLKPAIQASVPFFAVGTNDQHSILQQLADGPKNKLVLFFKCEELELDSYRLSFKEFDGYDHLNGKKYGQVIAAAARGTEQALAKVDVPTLNLEYKNHSAQNLGFLVMWFELVVATLGEMMDIDAFDQPGVEQSKILTKKILNGH
jgi:glucose-6-phosphate isomerase